MAIRDAARVSAQNQPTWEYEDAIEDIHANRLMEAAYEEQQRARNTQQLVLRAREILRRDYDDQQNCAIHTTKYNFIKFLWTTIAPTYYV